MHDEKELERNVVALGLITLSYAAFQGICQSIVPLSMAHQAFTKTTVGLIQAVPGITVILFGAPDRLHLGCNRVDELGSHVLQT